MRNDLSLAIRYFDLYSFLSRQDLKSRFRRSYLGIFWIVLQNLVFSLVAGLLWAKIFNLDPSNFIPFITIGFSVWSFISSSMIDGCGTFIIAHGYLKQLPLPQSIFIFRTLLTSLSYLLIGLATAIFVLLIFNKFSLLGLFYMLPGLVILMLYFYGTAGVLAYLGLRYRDLQYALTSVLSLLMIVTPVIYPPEVLIQKGVGFIVMLNPFASLIELVRYPLLNADWAKPEYYVISILFASIMIVLKYLLAKKWGRYVPFWS